MQFEFYAIGTRWTIDIYATLSQDEQKTIFKKIKNRIEIFDKTYSRFRSDSIVTQISRKKGLFTMPPDAKELFSLYRKIYEATNYKVTPLIGSALVDAGYDANYSLKPKKLNKIPFWDDVISYTHPKLQVKKPVLLDFGAAGKGYLIDIIAKLLEKNNIKDFCIDAGGDILHSNSKKEIINVGLEHPTDPKQIIGTAKISNQSICGSSVNRRNWGKFHHIISPFTLSSPKNILSIWAIADTAILADGMTTCLFFTKRKELQSKFKFEYLVLFENYSFEMSSNFPGVVYTDKGTISN